MDSGPCDLDFFSARPWREHLRETVPDFPPFLLTPLVWTECGGQLTRASRTRARYDPEQGGHVRRARFGGAEGDGRSFKLVRRSRARRARTAQARVPARRPRARSHRAFTCGVVVPSHSRRRRARLFRWGQALGGAHSRCACACVRRLEFGRNTPFEISHRPQSSRGASRLGSGSHVSVLSTRPRVRIRLLLRVYRRRVSGDETIEFFPIRTPT